MSTCQAVVQISLHLPQFRSKMEFGINRISKDKSSTSLQGMQKATRWVTKLKHSALALIVAPFHRWMVQSVLSHSSNSLLLITEPTTRVLRIMHHFPVKYSKHHLAIAHQPVNKLSSRQFKSLYQLRLLHSSSNLLSKYLQISLINNNKKRWLQQQGLFRQWTRLRLHQAKLASTQCRLLILVINKIMMMWL